MITFDINNKKIFKIILNSINILYIEDEENIRTNITNSLRMICAEVYDTESTKKAEELIKSHRIDVIISDINLAQDSGLEFIKKIRKLQINIPVILLSAYTNKEYLLEATKLKLVDYLVKPIDFNDLKDALLNACEELVSQGNYIVDFEDDVSYNVLYKKLYNRISNKEIDLTAKEISLLEYLINNKRIVSHEELKENIWADSFEATDSALKNLLTKIRKKIGKDTIKNISGVGFRIHFT